MDNIQYVGFFKAADIEVSWLNACIICCAAIMLYAQWKKLRSHVSSPILHSPWLQVFHIISGMTGYKCYLGKLGINENKTCFPKSFCTGSETIYSRDYSMLISHGTFGLKTQAILLILFYFSMTISLSQWNTLGKELCKFEGIIIWAPVGNLFWYLLPSFYIYCLSIDKKIHLVSPVVLW